MDQVKPLFRWTIGKVNKCGLDILVESVRRMRVLYDFEYVICHNNLSPRDLSTLEQCKVRLVDQNQYLDSVKYPPDGKCPACWKLFPPRLAIDRHELFMDNDIVLFKQVPEINEFLSRKNVALVYQGKFGLHGSYRLPQWVSVNSGIFGLPPSFDFSQEINNKIKPWADRFDDQGLVGSILTSLCQYVVVPQCRVPIMEPSWNITNWFSDMVKNVQMCGIHFVGGNRQDHCGFHYYSRGFKTML